VSNRVVKALIQGQKILRSPYYQGFAAQIAFYFMLSLVPIAILLTQLLGFFSISLDFLNEYIDLYMAEATGDILKSLLAYNPSGGLSIALVVISLWAASRVQFSLMRITNHTFGYGKGRGYIRERLRAIVTILITLLTVVSALIILVYGEVILNFIVSLLIKSTAVQYTISKFWLLIRWPIAMVLYFLMVSCNYYILPTKRPKFKEVIPGSLFASVAMLVFTLLFAVYTNNIADYDVIYGSLASVVVLMVWLLLISYALGLGIILNKAWQETTPLT